MIKDIAINNKYDLLIENNDFKIIETWEVIKNQIIVFLLTAENEVVLNKKQGLDYEFIFNLAREKKDIDNHIKRKINDFFGDLVSILELESYLKGGVYILETLKLQLIKEPEIIDIKEVFLNGN